MDLHIAENYRHLKDCPVLVAISGGVDSVVLAHILQKLDFNIAVAHVNFKLRGKESHEDQQFVENFARQNNLPLHRARFHTQNYARQNNLSIQLAARKLRDGWFDERKKKY